MKINPTKTNLLPLFTSTMLGILCSIGVLGVNIYNHSVEENEDDDKYNKGVTVSPSNIKFTVEPGKTMVRKVKVTNYTGSNQKFTVKYNDFDMTVEGKSSFQEPGTSKYSLSKILSIAPTFLEIEPGKSIEVSVTLQVPNQPEYNKAAWGVLLIEQAEEKKTLDPGNKSGNTIAFGITPTFAFGVWVYQNPPDVEMMSIDIKNFLYQKTDENKKMLTLSVENTGDGIAFCKAYSELTNLLTGEQFFLGGKNYTILPGYLRTFIFELPTDFPKSKYSAVGVIDYDSEEEIVAAEMDIIID